MSESMTDIIKIPMANLRFSITASSKRVSLGDYNNDRQPEMTLNDLERSLRILLCNKMFFGAHHARQFERRQTHTIGGKNVPGSSWTLVSGNMGITRIFQWFPAEGRQMTAGWSKAAIFSLYIFASLQCLDIRQKLLYDNDLSLTFH